MSVLMIDSHIDIPWEEKTEEGLPCWQKRDQADIALREAERRFTIPKAEAGGLGAACLAAYTPQAALDDAGHEAAWRRAGAMLEAMEEMVALHVSGRAALCRTARDVRQAAEAGKVALVPVMENGYPLADDPARIGHLARRYGVRYMTLTHNGHNLLADSAVVRQGPEEAHGGLSALGREVIGEMNRHGVLVDVSHASRKTMMQAVETSTVPVFASHSCVRALCDHPRNLDDGQLDALKVSGGLIQITAMGPFLRRGGGGTLKDFVGHVLYVARRIGIEHVGISSDFDGGGGIEGWQDASETHHLLKALEQTGLDASEIRALCGGNMLRLLEKAEEKTLECQT
ncbi:diguanylate cyclase [Bombella intestini]|uniref:Diguanylate cyclase n=1 Tax=Bombella intestini TaxID=1539051 RepID=A0A1S8GRG3_9PROT|nr:dipeptidase [Bombella intestini]OOL19565.1 diguanylate cyclase [Bombella intestini]